MVVRRLTVRCWFLSLLLWMSWSRRGFPEAPGKPTEGLGEPEPLWPGPTNLETRTFCRARSSGLGGESVPNVQRCPTVTHVFAQLPWQSRQALADLLRCKRFESLC